MLGRLLPLLNLGLILVVVLACTGWVLFLGFIVGAGVKSASQPSTGQHIMVTPTALPASTASGNPTPLTSPIVTMTAQDTSFAFTPSQLTIRVGSTVTWKNPSTAPHTVVGFGVDSGLIMPAQTFTHTFTEPGDDSYVCTLHPGMVGAITVVS
jgi:plastocyanin